MNKAGRTGTLTALALIAATGQPVHACMPVLYVKQAGETDADLKRRIEADQEATRRYAALPASERAAIDQARWWDSYPQVYVAQVDHILVRGKVYPAPRKPAPRHSSTLPLPPVPMEPPPLLTADGHKAWLRPIARLKGDAAPAPGWQEVGGRTSCGGPPDGALGYTFPGDTVIVFADNGSLFGLDPADSAEPRLIAALRREGLAPRPPR